MAARIKPTGSGKKERDLLKAGQLMKRLSEHALDEEDNPKKRMTPSQVQAAAIALKKLVPDLSAVEQTTVNELDHQTEAQLNERLQALISNDPDMSRKLLEMLIPKTIHAEKGD